MKLKYTENQLLLITFQNATSSLRCELRSPWGVVCLDDTQHSTVQGGTVTLSVARGRVIQLCGWLKFSSVLLKWSKEQLPGVLVLKCILQKPQKPL